MKRLLVLLLLSSGTIYAQSPFDGTWVINSDSAQLPDKPEVYLLDRGVFHCPTCVPKVEIKADGRDQPVTGASYFDTENIRVVDAYSVEFVAKKSGKTMFTEIDTVSPDGDSLTQLLKDTTEAQPVTIETLSRRIDKGPAGSHALSGSWRAYKVNRSKNGSTITYKSTKETFSAETPLGEKFNAAFDGKYYPVGDDPGHTMVSVRRLDPNTVEITSKRDGRVVGILRLSVASNGKSIHVTFNNIENHLRNAETILASMIETTA
jgi:hypothetical protein